MTFMFAFFLGAALVAVLPRLPPTWVPLLFLPFCVYAARPWAVFLAGLLAGIAWGVASGHRLSGQWLAPGCERVPVTLQGHVAGLPAESVAFGDRRVQRFPLDVSALEPARCAGPGRVQLSYYGDSVIRPGSYGEFVAVLRVPWGLSNPGAGNREAWYAMNGVHAVGSVRSLSLAERGSPWRYRHHDARAALLRSIDALPGDKRSKDLLAALTVGARDRLAPSEWNLLKELGVVHLAVISGLHVSLASGAGALLGKLLARGAALVNAGALWRQLPGALALGFAITYAALAGFSLPTVRALVMLAGVVGAMALGRDALSPHTLLLAVFVLVLLQPLAMIGAGFWLSLGAVSALLWFVSWQPRRQPLVTTLKVHLYLCVAMLPLTAWWFGGGSLVAPLANAVAVPVVGVLVVPLTLLASVVDGVSPAVAALLWQVPLGLLQVLLALADGLATRVPDMAYRALPGGAYAAINAGVAVLLLGVRLPALLRIVTASLLLPLFSRPSPGLSVDGAELAVLDVGQGTSVVVNAGGRALVYDTGGGEPGGYTAAAAALIPYLQWRGVESVDTLVVSHADRDHSAGTRALVDAFPVRRLLYGQALPGVAAGTPCRAGAAWSWSNSVSFQVLAGGEQGGARANDSSCVLLVDLAGHRFLLPGDISAQRERDLVLYWREALRADWLLAAHHGSGSSTSAAWLRAVAPHGVILNHRRANPFGHPHPDVVARLSRRAIVVRSTAEHGAILFHVTPEGDLEVSVSRGGPVRFWHPPG